MFRPNDKDNNTKFITDFQYRIAFPDMHKNCSTSPSAEIQILSNKTSRDVCVWCRIENVIDFCLADEHDRLDNNNKINDRTDTRSIMLDHRLVTLFAASFRSDSYIRLDGRSNLCADKMSSSMASDDIANIQLTLLDYNWHTEMKFKIKKKFWFKNWNVASDEYFRFFIKLTYTSVNTTDMCTDDWKTCGLSTERIGFPCQIWICFLDLPVFSKKKFSRKFYILGERKTFSFVFFKSWWARKQLHETMAFSFFFTLFRIEDHPVFFTALCVKSFRCSI